VKTALNARFTAAETTEALLNCEPAALIAGSGFAERVEPGRFPSLRHRVAIGPAPAGYRAYEELLAAASDQPPPVAWAPDDLAVLHFSSGSTGRIKAAMQSYGNRLAAFRKARLGMEGCGPDTRVALLGPLTHATGMMMQPYLSVGATLVVFDKFEPGHFLREVERLRLTHAFLVPAMLNMLLGALAGSAAPEKLVVFEWSNHQSLDLGRVRMRGIDESGMFFGHDHRRHHQDGAA